MGHMNSSLFGAASVPHRKQRQGQVWASMGVRRTFSASPRRSTSSRPRPVVCPSVTLNGDCRFCGPLCLCSYRLPVGEGRPPPTRQRRPRGRKNHPTQRAPDGGVPHCPGAARMKTRAFRNCKVGNAPANRRRQPLGRRQPCQSRLAGAGRGLGGTGHGGVEAESKSRSLFCSLNRQRWTAALRRHLDSRAEARPRAGSLAWRDALLQQGIDVLAGHQSRRGLQ